MQNISKDINTNLGERVRERRLDLEVDLDLLRLHKVKIKSQSLPQRGHDHYNTFQHSLVNNKDSANICMQ